MPSYEISQAVLPEADAEARRLGHPYIAPEHLLIAATAAVEGEVHSFCQRHQLTHDAVRDAVAELVGKPLTTIPAVDSALPIALRSQLALAHAVLAAKQRGDPRFTPSELFVALLHDDVASRGVVGAVLERFGLTPAVARREIGASAEDSGTT